MGSVMHVFTANFICQRKINKYIKIVLFLKAVPVMVIKKKKFLTGMSDCYATKLDLCNSFHMSGLLIKFYL